jgi:uncharacterized protein with PQ loop repeat
MQGVFPLIALTSYTHAFHQQTSCNTSCIHTYIPSTIKVYRSRNTSPCLYSAAFPFSFTLSSSWSLSSSLIPVHLQYPSGSFLRHTCALYLATYLHVAITFWHVCSIFRHAPNYMPASYCWSMLLFIDTTTSLSS